MTLKVDDEVSAGDKHNRKEKTRALISNGTEFTRDVRKCLNLLSRLGLFISSLKRYAFGGIRRLRVWCTKKVVNFFPARDNLFDGAKNVSLSDWRRDLWPFLRLGMVEWGHWHAGFFAFRIVFQWKIYDFYNAKIWIILQVQFAILNIRRFPKIMYLSVNTEFTLTACILIKKFHFYRLFRKKSYTPEFTSLMQLEICNQELMRGLFHVQKARSGTKHTPQGKNV